MPTRPITGPLTRSVTRGVTELGAGGAFSPSASFFAGAQGFAYDLSDASKLYVDSARTVQVATAGDLIGSVTDLSGNGNHASQGTSASKPAWQTTYAAFDGFDDFLQTASVNFTATDKVTVVAGVRKLSDSGGVVVELSASVDSSTGTFVHACGNVVGGFYGALARGAAAVSGTQAATTSAYLAPDTSVFSALHDIAGDSSKGRRNGVQFANAVGDKGAGNFGNYPVYIGRRGGTMNPLNGRIYRMIVIGRLLTNAELLAAEKWCNDTTGAY